MKTIFRIILWSIMTVLGISMIYRGIWAVRQPWGSRSDKLFALAFFTSITGFFIYQLFVYLKPKSRWTDMISQDLINGIGSLVLFSGALFYLLQSHSSREILIGCTGIIFFGACAVVLFRNSRANWKRRWLSRGKT